MAWIVEDLLHAVADFSAAECITEQRMAELTGQNLAQVGHSALKLRKFGFMEKTSQGCHTLTEAGVAAAAERKKIRSGPTTWTGKKVVKGSLRIRAWSAMCLREKFSLNDLCMLCAQGHEKDIACNLRKYVTALEKAGYLVRLAKRESGSALTSNGFVRWWLRPEMVTGRQAPVWSARNKSVYDPNTEKTISFDQEARHVA